MIIYEKKHKKSENKNKNNNYDGDNRHQKSIKLMSPSTLSMMII